MNIVIIELVRLIQRRDIVLFILCVLFFLYFPQVDLWVSNWFYDGQGFYLNANPVVYGMYWVFARLQYVILVVLLGFSLSSIFVSKNQGKLWRKQCRFIFFVLLLGPGIIVNGIAKNHSIGRARPVHIEQFGGQGHFTPAFVYSGQCKKNCSFVSGHASFGFAFMSLFFLRPRKRLLVAGITLGAIVGLGRIMQGGHFLSDVIFGFWFTYFSMLLVARLMVYECQWLGLRGEEYSSTKNLRPSLLNPK